MDDLVAELRKQARICETSKAIGSITKDRCEAAMNEAAARIQALETSLAEAEGRVKPQPISTAPRDGTFVLLFGGKTDEDDYGDLKHLDQTRPVVGMWVADVCAETWMFKSDDDDAEVDWWAVCYWDSDWRTGYINPTHWMPLAAALETGEWKK